MAVRQEKTVGTGVGDGFIGQKDDIGAAARAGKQTGNLQKKLFGPLPFPFC